MLLAVSLVAVAAGEQDHPRRGSLPAYVSARTASASCVNATGASYVFD